MVFLKKVSLLLLTIATRMNVLFWIIRRLNYRFKLINSIFVCYAGHERHVRHYGFKSIERFYRWNPLFLGIFKQGGSWGIVYGVSATEKSILKKANRNELVNLVNRANAIASQLGVNQVNYGGILPSLLFSIDLLPDDSHNDKAGLIVSKAYESLSKELYSESVPVILLGGAGSVGKYTHQWLVKNNVEVHIVDPAVGNTEIPHFLRGRNAVVIDTARKSCLRQYKDQFWPEMAILNETFPAPSRRTVADLSDRGLSVYHLSGVTGKCLPSLPFGYRNSIPCCAIHNIDSQIEPVIIQLPPQNS